MSVALATLLTACASTPYETPQVPMSAQFTHAGEESDAASQSADWWTAFNDPALNALISDVLARNNDLAAAALKVQQAKLQAGLTKLDQFPSASGSLGVSSSDSTSYSSSLSVSYEADLYGKLAAATRSANWEAQATEEDRQASRLSLIGTACELYWRIGYTHQQITSGQQDLDYALKVQNLVNIQHDAGAASGVEVAEADQTVNSQRASLADLQQQLVEYRASLTVLLGGTPLPETSEPQALPDIALPDVRAGLPSELLSRRPDLRAAELRLRENLADVDIAKKAFYPGLTLTASGGSSSSELSNLFKNPTGALAASLSLPFLDFPRLSRDVKISRKTYEIAVLDFKTTLLNALADTDNALSNRTQLAAQGEAQKASLDAARKAEDLYAIRYRTGSVALRTWLDAQSSRRSTQLTYDNIRLSQLINQSTLYQALGGGTDAEQ
ncbi:MAG: efflux transporter outer membrane subunit [Asticcacaulis sp.]|uniref:efflux transporter outer membrane subunit n=1 Tax=Asticcacaulis sp. TaxID=1872648 RepID=UPI0039E6DEDA